MKIVFTKKKIFLIAYVLTLCSWMMENVNFISSFLDYLRYFSYLLLIIVIFMNYNKFTLKRFLFELLGTIIIFVSSVFSKSNTLLTLWIFVLSSRCIEFDKLVKVDFITKFILVIVVCLCYYLGLTGKSIFYGYFGAIRSSMGFGNPNTFGYYIFSLCADYIYLNNKKINIYHTIVLIVIALIVGKLSYSRTSQLLICLLGFSLPITKLFRKVFNYKFFKIFILNLFLICAFVSYYIAANYKSANPIYYNINELLSGRVLNAHRFLEKYNVSIIGNENILTTNDKSYTYYLDNGYIKLLLNYGVLSFIIIYLIYYNNFKKAFENKNIFLILIFTIYLIYGLSENVMFWLSGNIFLLYYLCEPNNNNKEVIL